MLLSRRDSAISDTKLVCIRDVFFLFISSVVCFVIPVYDGEGRFEFDVVSLMFDLRPLNELFYGR